ncbi:MAG: hypothetical protein PWP31_909 [Clostridia bacterium]|nr:hypothetical protein [Clostridia bacterium]
MSKKYSTWQIAATFVGTVVGAGFASGQELLQFFGYFGFIGVIGLALTTVLLIFFGYIVLKLGYKLQAESHLPVMNFAGGRWVGRTVDIITTFFLFGVLAVMAAGSGAVFRQEFGLSTLLGSSLLIGLSLITVLLGINRVIEAISFVAPILVFSVLSISFYTIVKNFPVLLTNLSWSEPLNAAAPNWLLAALLYTSYNLVLAIAVLAPLGALAKENKLLPGAILGGGSLGFSAMAITLALIATAPAVTALEVPMLHIAGNLSPVFRTLYGVVLLAEVYTTGVSSLYGFAARLTKPNTKKFRLLAMGTSFVALVASQFGFSQLVSILFPLVGYGGLVLLGALAFYFLKTQFQDVQLPFLRYQPAPALKPLKNDNKKEK